MPIIGISTYRIDFFFLENNDPKTIVLLDQSTYLTTPVQPLVEVTLPGYTGIVEFAYIPSTVIVITSDNLNLTYSASFGLTADLPDGVYQIALKVCPYGELYNKKCYLKTSTFQAQFEELLRNLDLTCTCIDEKTLKEAVVDIDILIQSAKAEANICNIDIATTKFKAAVKKLKNINKKLNCA